MQGGIDSVVWEFQWFGSFSGFEVSVVLKFQWISLSRDAPWHPAYQGVYLSPNAFSKLITSNTIAIRAKGQKKSCRTA